MNAQEARQLVYENLRATGCPDRIAKYVFEVPGSIIETAEALLKSRKVRQLRGAAGIDVATESMLTGKSFEQLLEERSPERYKTLQRRLAAEAHRNYLAVIAKRSVGEYVDRIHQRLAVSIAEQIALDSEYEKRWDAIRTNLRCAGAQGTER